jgi:hypothetical protein
MRRPFVGATLRIEPELYQRVQQKAHEQRTTINATMKWLIEQGLEQTEKRTFGMLIEDQESAWDKFAERFLARELDHNILAALEARDFERARRLAIDLREHQETLAQKRKARMQEANNAR